MTGIGAATVYTISVLFSLLVVGIYILGAARYLTNLEGNTCDMTYMFQYPQYVKISLDKKTEDRYPRYGLYAYGEGFYTEKVRRMRFSGIPVLFVPGNAGSHEQVRSIASVSLRKSIKDKTHFHFDYFSVSLGKDYSALYGGVLEDQTEFVSLSINKILSLYNGKINQIVLIGHSMGGIVVKGALLRKAMGNSSVASILLTLASAHKPIFLPDRTLVQYYDELEGFTERLRKLGTIIVSIGGGERDILVSPSQTVDNFADINILSSAIPEVWRSTDHLCILWCKQLVLTIVQALFDAVDTNASPPAISHRDDNSKLDALFYHFTSRFAGKKYRPYEERVEFERGAEWIEDIRRQYTWMGNNKEHNKTVFLMIRLGIQAYDTLSIEAFKLEARDWIFACSAHALNGNSRVCEWGWNLTNRTSLSPDPHHRLRKSLDLHLKDLRISKMSHLVLRIPAGELANKKNLIRIHVDLYKFEERQVRLQDYHNYLNFFRLSRIFSPDPYAIVTSTRGSLRYCVDLSGILDAISVEIELNGGTHEDVTKNESPQGIFQLLEPLGDNNTETFTYGQFRTVVLNEKSVESTRRKRFAIHLTRSGTILRMSLEPEYSYRMVIRRAGIVERVACSVRDRWPTLYPIIVGLSLLAIASRIDNAPRKTAIIVAFTFLGAIWLDFLLELFVAVGLLHVYAFTVCCLVVFLGSVANKVAARFLSRIIAIPSLWFDRLLGGLDRLPILITFALLALIPATCGAIAVLLSVPLYFLKLTRMYDEYLEELLMASLRHFNPFGDRRRKRKWRYITGVNVQSNDATTTTDQSDKVNKVDDSEPPTQTVVAPVTNKTSMEAILNHLLLFMTWTLAALPAIPTALVWAKNFRHETRLTTEDPTMFFSWLILTACGSLGLVNIPSSLSNHPKNRRQLCANVLRSITWILLYTAALKNSPRYQWIVPPLVTAAIICLSLHKIFPGRSHQDVAQSLIPNVPNE